MINKLPPLPMLPIKSPMDDSKASSFDSPIRRPSLENKTEDPDEIRNQEIIKAAKQFESVLVHQLLKAMRETVSMDEEDQDFGKQTVTEMFDQELSESTSGKWGFGNVIAKELGAKLSATADLPWRSPITAVNAKPMPTLSKVMNAKSRGFSNESPTMGVVPGNSSMFNAMPVEGIVSSPYGPRVHPVSGKSHFHSGIDIAAPEGTEIHSVRSGKVVFSGKQRGYGNTIEVRHDDGTIARYAHASRLHVRVGDRVEQGEAVADVGSTGQSTGPHLHFEIRRKGTPIDPNKYLEASRLATTAKR